MNSIIKKIGFFSAFILVALVVIGFYIGGLANYFAIAFAFLLLPIFDELLGIDKKNLSDEEEKVVGSEFYYRFVTYIWTYVQLAFIFWGAYAAASGRLQSITEWVGFILSFSLVTGGIGITVAHELGHKKTAIEKFYSKLLLMTVYYMHFYIEHNRGHHVHVATLSDPATARKGETFYAFWFRSVFGGYSHALKIEKESLKNKGFGFWNIRNEMIWFALIPFLFILAITLLFCFIHERIVWEVPIFLFLQSIAAFTLLELVNYVEHYGILRREIKPGKFELVNPIHSWNASQLLSNFFLFQLQRHSDHHAFAYKRYQILKHYDESPQLPFGYPTMIIIALFPPLWFGIMDNKLQTWQGHLIRN